jgi:hypothetical protein
MAVKETAGETVSIATVADACVSVPDGERAGAGEGTNELPPACVLGSNTSSIPFERYTGSIPFERYTGSIPFERYTGSIPFEALETMCSEACDESSSASPACDDSAAAAHDTCSSFAVEAVIVVTVCNARASVPFGERAGAGEDADAVVVTISNARVSVPFGERAVAEHDAEVSDGESGERDKPASSSTREVEEFGRWERVNCRASGVTHAGGGISPVGGKGATCGASVETATSGTGTERHGNGSLMNRARLHTRHRRIHAIGSLRQKHSCARKPASKGR